MMCRFGVSFLLFKRVREHTNPFSMGFVFSAASNGLKSAAGQVFSTGLVGQSVRRDGNYRGHIRRAKGSRLVNKLGNF
jgi:hypothetical protein